VTAPDPARADAAARLPGRIAFLGFGLIGGSIARALRAAGSHAQLVAWTPGGAGPAEGMARGILDEAAVSTAEAIDGAGLVILAGPPLAVVATLADLAGPLRAHLGADTTVTDVASTKAQITASASAHELRFVGGHPMAGRETTGVAAATADLFVGRPWVIVPTEKARPIDVERVRALALSVGARPLPMAADEHDAAVAAISHLPLVLAAALVQSVAGSPEGTSNWPAASELAATGWRDMTRLALGDPEMGAGILATNAAPVAERLRALRGAIDQWLEVLDAGGERVDAGEIRDRLEAARRALEPERRGRQSGT
jgi:prephenate dehydrogenase